jgi:hypothetical protein
MTKIVAIVGTYRRGKTIDTLVAKAAEGAKAAADEVTVNTIRLIDKRIEYCRNCMVCKGDDSGKEVADCVIRDDLTALFPVIRDADALIFATPINCGTVTAVMKTFLERTCWTFAKPGGSPIPGCPTPRSTKKRRAIILLSTGLVPPELREACDDATPLITSNCECCFNAEVVGSLYAGAVDSVGVGAYLDEAFRLGRELVAGHAP